MLKKLTKKAKSSKVREVEERIAHSICVDACKEMCKNSGDSSQGWLDGLFREMS